MPHSWSAFAAHMHYILAAAKQPWKLRLNSIKYMLFVNASKMKHLRLPLGMVDYALCVPADICVAHVYASLFALA